MKFKHIQSFVNEGIDIDTVLKKTSYALFKFHKEREDDKKYRQILYMIAKEGPSTTYKLGEIGQVKFELDRYAIRRRILGSNVLLSLLKEEFVTEELKNETHPSGGEKIRYCLTLKGLMTSLYYPKFEESYLANDLYRFVSDLTGNRYNIADLTILYVKYHMALTMLWYKMMGFTLTSQHDLVRLFSRTITKMILFENYPLSELNETESAYFYDIGERFYALTFVIVGIIRKLARSRRLPVFLNKKMDSFIHGTRFKTRTNSFIEFFDRHILVDWALYFDMSNIHHIDANNPYLVDYGPSIHHRITLWQDHALKESINRILKKIEVNKVGRIDVSHLL